MSQKLLITEEPEDLQFNQRIVQYRRNGEWLTKHGTPLFQQYPARYLAVSEEEVFVADTAGDARRLAREKHPDDEPFIQYVPRDNYERIYAC